MRRLSWRHFDIRGKEAMMRKRRGFRDDEGSSLVETALALSILFALLIGIFEFSMAFYTYHYVSDALARRWRWSTAAGTW